MAWAKHRSAVVGGNPLNSTVKTALLWVVIIVLVFLLWSLFNTAKGESDPIEYSTFRDRVTQGHVEKITVRGDEIRGETKTTAPGGETQFHTTGPIAPLADNRRMPPIRSALVTSNEAPTAPLLMPSP